MPKRDASPPRTVTVCVEHFNTEHLEKLRETLDTTVLLTPVRIADLFQSDYERLRRMTKARKVDSLEYRGIRLCRGRMRRGRDDGSVR